MPDQYHVLVTGASKGIGRATALYLDRIGYHVMAGVRREQDAHDLQAAASSRLTPLMIDVTQPDMIAAAAEQARGITGDDGLYGLVNNAGVAVVGPLEFMPMEDLRWQFEVNVYGQVAVTQAMMPLLRQAKGRVIMMSSVSGIRAIGFGGPYAGSKHALEALAASLRQELNPWGIEVSSILPGVIDTPIWETTTQAMQQRLDEGAIPQAAYNLYGETLRGSERLARRGQQTGAPPLEVARAVQKALVASRPRTRYYVGKDAHLIRLLNGLLPPRWLDVILRRA